MIYFKTMKKMNNKYIDIKSVLNLQDEKINKLNIKFEQILFNQNKIIEMLEQNNLQKVRQMYLLRAKKRLRIFVYLFSLIFIFYYLDIFQLAMNFYDYYYHFLDLFTNVLDSINKIQSCSENIFTVQKDIQKVLDNQEQLLETNNIKTQSVSKMSFTAPIKLKPFYFF